MSASSKEFVGKIKGNFTAHNGLSVRLKGVFTAHDGMLARSKRLKNVQILCDVPSKVTAATRMSIILIDRSFKCHGDL